jgi:antitoxin (DNA-binding transcriptional repressor) of toxin-antitoxin stability system
MTRVMTIVTISKSRLKSHMLEVFRDLETNGGELVVTDRGKPVLRITPIGKKSPPHEVFADYQGKLVWYEDPDTPTASEWEEEDP